MQRYVLLACLLAGSLAACSWLPRAGPSTSDVVEQARVGGDILFDVVPVDDRVVSTLLAQPKESFARHFDQNAPPPEVKVGIGDTISVMIWESAAGGLFTEAPPIITGPRPETEPLAPEVQPPSPGFGVPGQAPRQRSEAETRQESRPPASGNVPSERFSPEAALAASGRQAAVIPDQQVGPDGAISVPYGGRIPAAGRLPAEIQQTIQDRLAGKALQPQALVIVKKSAVNAVTVTGEVVTGARIPISPGGDRLLQVIAAAGGAKAPVHETFVRLLRGGVSATIPLQQLVLDPTEDIYAHPGDVLTLVQTPQTFNVFGATGRNAKIPFDADNLTLGEALGKSQGLRDDLAKPEGVFLFRYESDPIVRALNQPIATGAQGGVSPIVYRFNLRDSNSYLIARQFPIRDKDVIFVADAPAAQIYKFFAALNNVTGPIVTGLVTCHYANC